MFSPSPLYHLKTESVEPLVTIVKQLSEQIRANDRRIGLLAQFVDTHITDVPTPTISPEVLSYLTSLEQEFAEFGGCDTRREQTSPKDDDSNDSGSKDENEAKIDPLTHHLETKYQLLKVPQQDVPHSDNPRVMNLRQDIAKLKIIKQQKSIRNVELCKLVEEYETALLTVVMPALREKLSAVSKEMQLDTTKKVVDQKQNLMSEVYGMYVQNITLMEQLLRVLRILGGFLGDERIDNLYHQLEVLGRLKEDSRE